MNKKRIAKIIDIVFLLYILILTALEISKLMEGDINLDNLPFEMLGIKEYMTMFVSVLCFFLFTMIIVLFNHFYLVILYFGIRLAYKRYSKERLDKVDFKNNEYYREIIKKYSPGELSYLHDFEVNKKDIIATLMSLELKQKIKIEDQIYILNENTDSLAENEKYVLENIKKNTLNTISISTFKNLVIQDCLKNNLLEEKQEYKKKGTKKIINCIILYTFVLGGFYFFPSIMNAIAKDNDLLLLLFLTIMLILFLLMIIFPYTASIYIHSYYFMNRINPYIRKKEGKELNTKLEGLRKYLKEFSILNEKEYQELIVWKEYLIYSVIFNQNNEIISSIENKLKIRKEKIKCQSQYTIYIP